MANRDAAVEASGALKTVAISLSNIANNIRWLASGPRCGIGEIQIPELQPGSSIMPGKVNPVIPEAVMMVAAQVVGNDATIAWANALGSNFDLNVMMPVIAYNLLQSIDLLANAAEHLADKCVDAEKLLAGQGRRRRRRGSRPTPSAASELIERSLAMCTALAPRIGYDNAAAIAKKAYQGRAQRPRDRPGPRGQDPRGGRGTGSDAPGLGGRAEGKRGLPDRRGDRTPARPARPDRPRDRRRGPGGRLSFRIERNRSQPDPEPDSSDKRTPP